jgi:hypothetical protein
MQRDKHKKERMFDSACQAFTEHPLPSAPCLNDSRRWTARCGTASIMLALSPVKASRPAQEVARPLAILKGGAVSLTFVRPNLQ